MTSRVVSTAATPLAGSRHGSMSSLLDLEGGGGGGGGLPDTIGQIQAMTEQQEAVMSFYYTDTDNQLKLMEIFDVTAADELIGDTELGVDYSCEQVHISTCLNIYISTYLRYPRIHRCCPTPTAPRTWGGPPTPAAAATVTARTPPASAARAGPAPSTGGPADQCSEVRSREIISAEND